MLLPPAPNDHCWGKLRAHPFVQSGRAGACVVISAILSFFCGANYYHYRCYGTHFHNSSSSPSQSWMHSPQETSAELRAVYQRAAQAVLAADVFLLATGAGFSADSGLAVYKDIADIEVYRRRHLTYSDICETHWLDEEPELFYGFWGKCFNDYRDTLPHAGYSTLLSWFQHRFTSKDSPRDSDEAEKAPLSKQKSYFLLTSNVDEHFLKAGFSPKLLYEIHGNVEVWQCHILCNRTLVWRAPSEFRFNVSSDSMLALPDSPPAHEATGMPKFAPGTMGADCSIPVDSIVRGFRSNHPRCPSCGALSRPNVLMFGDFGWISNDNQELQWRSWRRYVLEMAKAHEDLKVVIMEIGCGKNVPSIRYMVEGFAHDLGEHVTVIRINPDYPTADSRSLVDRMVSIRSRGLPALQAVEAKMRDLESAGYQP